MGTSEPKVTQEVAVTQAETTSEITLVRQEELVKYISLDNQIDKLTKERNLLEEDLKRLLMAGVKVEDGVHVAEIKYGERRTPKWKECAIELADKLKGAGQGEKWAAKVIENTEPTPSIKLTVR